MNTTTIATKTAIANSAGVLSAANTAAPYEIYGDILTTHGFWIMSWASWLKVIGGIYILVLILKFLGFFKLLKWIFSRIYNNCVFPKIRNKNWFKKLKKIK